MSDLATLGQRIRHFRTARGLTLDELGAAVGVAGSQLSLMENGKREPRLSLLTKVAESLDIQVSDLLSDEPPSARAALEIRLDQLQQGALYSSLGLPMVRPGRTMTDDTLRSLVGLHAELARRAREAIATPEEARRANTELRQLMRTKNNYLPDIDKLAQELVTKVGYSRGAITHRAVAQMARQLGFELVHVPDLPHSARSVTDLENGRIYLPPASIPGGHGIRSMALQAMAHRLLGHHEPKTYAEFLQQRLEINYFATACLMPLQQSVEFLEAAKADRNIAVEDYRDAFGVTHEAAALRFTNLATSHLDLTVHFLRVGDDGAVAKAYENDGLRLPVDVTGSTEGQLVCRYWAARQAFDRTNRTTEFYQYTDTPEGHLLGVEPDRDLIRGRVLDHDRRSVRTREVVPWPGDHEPHPFALSGCHLLPGAVERARPALGRQGVDEREAARAHPVAAAQRNFPGRRRSGVVRVSRRPCIAKAP